MLIGKGMRVAGSVSGGCIEGAVIEEALDALENGESRRLSFGVEDELARDADQVERAPSILTQVAARRGEVLPLQDLFGLVCAVRCGGMLLGDFCEGGFDIGELAFVVAGLSEFVDVARWGNAVANGRVCMIP